MNAYRAHISAHKRNALLRCFINEVTATKAAEDCKVDRNTANHWYRYFRTAIAAHQKRLFDERRLSGEVEADHSFFGARGRKRYIHADGKFVLRPRQKFTVFAFLERHPDGRHVVSSHLITKADTATLLPLVRRVVEPGARIYTDSWRSFNALAKDGYIHRTVNHRRKQFAKKDGAYSVHTGTLDQYFKFAKGRLAKFGALHPETIRLHLRECEFRYNNKDTAAALRKILD